MDEQDYSRLYGTLAPNQFYRRDGARLTANIDPRHLKLSTTPQAVHAAYHDFDKAHAVMLAETGIIPAEVAPALLNGLLEMEKEDHLTYREESEYGCHAGEAYLIDTLGEDVGGWLHIGRSTRDLRETAARVVARKKLLELITALLELCAEFAECAAEHIDVTVPSFTRFQHAQVTTIGFHLLSLERPLERDIERLWGAYERLKVSPAGTAAGTGTDFPIDRERTASLLGFESVADNATDVDKSSDIHLESAFAPVIVLHNIATAAELFLLWSSREYGLLEVPDDLCGTSSIMPQKKNPLGLIVIKNLVDDAIGNATSALAAGRSLGGRASVPLASLDGAGRAAETFKDILAHSSFNCEVAENLIYEEWALASDLAAHLVRMADIPWRSAHQIVAILCREASEDGRGIRDIGPGDVASVSASYLGRKIVLDAHDLEETLEASNAVAARGVTTGTPAPDRVRDQLTATDAFLTNQRNQLREERESIAAADDRLAESIACILAGDNGE